MLPIELNSFDIVLGIDWLSVNNAESLYRKKMVRVNPLGKESFMVYGDKHRVNFGIISLMKAWKMFVHRMHIILGICDRHKEGEERDTKNTSGV